MGPPREHGGMQAQLIDAAIPELLQWGRRVNTAECIALVRVNPAVPHASMGPPREHGGMLAV